MLNTASNSGRAVTEMPDRDRENFRTAFSYEIGAELGRGACGVVYKGIFGPKVESFERNGKLYCRPGDQFAVKFINMSNMLVSDKYKEARLLTELEHEYIVNVILVITFAGKRLYILMEFADRGSLLSYFILIDRWLTSKRKINGVDYRMVKENVAKEWCCHMLMGLGYLHNNGVIHMDIHCGNVLLFYNADYTTSGKIMAKLSDFGSASKWSTQIRIDNDLQCLSRVAENLIARTKLTNEESRYWAGDLVQAMSQSRQGSARQFLLTRWMTTDMSSRGCAVM